MEQEIIKELSKKYNKKEKLIKNMIEILKEDYNILESKKIIEDFYFKNYIDVNEN